MKTPAATYWKLFSSTFYLSAFTFGGGFVIIPLMKKKFVDNLHWIDRRRLSSVEQQARPLGAVPGDGRRH